MTDITTSISKVSRSALKQAGTVLLREFGKKTVISNKNGHEITIPQDTLAEQIIIEKIAQRFPKHTIIGEELGEHPGDSDYSWIIDPLEGTSNYASGLPLWATQLAVTRNNEIIHAVAHAPCSGDYYWATKGKGCWLAKSRLSVTLYPTLNQVMISLGKGSQNQHIEWWGEMANELSKHVRTIRLFGATGLELAFVAEGRIAAHINFGSKVTDYASGVLLVREAGGVVKNFEGEDWKMGDTSVIAGNSKLVDQLLHLNLHTKLY